MVHRFHGIYFLCHRRFVLDLYWLYPGGGWFWNDQQQDISLEEKAALSVPLIYFIFISLLFYLCVDR